MSEKYRICKNELGEYKIQYKFLFWWLDMTETDYFFGEIIRRVKKFNTLEQAEKTLKKYLEGEERCKKENTWVCKGEY